MPWYLNVTRSVIRAERADGTQVGFGPREKIFIPRSQMSVYIQEYINNKQLKYMGSGQDLEPKPVSVHSDVVAMHGSITANEDGEMSPINDIQSNQQGVQVGSGASSGRRRRRKRQ